MTLQTTNRASRCREKMLAFARKFRRSKPETKPKPFRTVEHGKKHLFELPAEVMNRIMEMSLLEPGHINITSSSPKQPGVLQVCKRLREQYIEMYYTENDFHIVAQDYNFEPVVPAFKVHQKYCSQARDSLKYYHIGGVRNWQNLKKWCKLVSVGRIRRMSADPSTVVQETRVVCSVLDAVHHLSQLNMRWEEIEPVVDSMREGLIAANAAWAT